MKRLYSTLYISYVTIIIICVLVVAVYAGVSLRGRFLAELSSDLRVRAQLAGQMFLRIPVESRIVECDSICEELGRAAEARITIMDLDGNILGDSLGDAETMDNHGSRPEVVGALECGLGENTRFSKTLRKYMFYVAIPLLRNQEAIGVVRIAVPEDETSEQLRPVYAALGLGALVAAALALIVGGLIGRSIVKPLESLGRAAGRIGKGDLDVRVEVSTNDELGVLSNAFNEMATRLEFNVDALAAQRNEMHSILSSMKEGIITVDRTGRVLLANQAFKEMMGAEGNDVVRMMLIEAVRNATLAQFVKEAQTSPGQSEIEIVLQEPSHRIMSLHAVPLIGGDSSRVGTLIVARDVTRMRQLEEIRTSFVANVSHELKTPITLIKGYVETLLDGALNDAEKLPEFLSKVKKHSNRMNSIIDDLLQLSKLEAVQEMSEATVINIVSVADRVRSNFMPIASSKGLDLRLEAPERPVNVKANESLLEQAIGDLVDNAVKYTAKGGHIVIKVCLEYNVAILVVRDDGIGIERRHINRIFERFYRADSARSRELGGTGLGLSIVKHIVALHGGSMQVESQPGRGSTFTMRLPAV
ncbi:HAMP domain-containing protein [bacterium]|nr:HAMP domain-containing protein [bacterium]